MARAFNGTTQYLSAASSLLTNEPIGMFCFAKSNDAATQQVQIGLGNNGASGLYISDLAGSVGGDPVRAIKQNDGGTTGASATTAGYSTGVWLASGHSFRSDTSRDSYKDGANKGSDTTNVSDPTPDFISIGCTLRSTAQAFHNGDIANAFIFNYAPTDAEHALLGKGIHPIDVGIPIANIKAWYPLIADDNNRMAGGYPNLTPTGSPTFSSHPFQPIYPRVGALLSM
jgi:hypothetical protein